MNRKQIVALVLVLVLALFAVGWASGAKSLNAVWQQIQKKEFVDLTHPFAPGIPHWPGYPDEQSELLFWYDAQPPGPGTLGTGFYQNYTSIVGEWGTHVDAPALFVNGGRTLDEIAVEDMLLPLVVLDVHEKVAADPDYTVTMDDLSAWEKRNGQIPDRAFVALRTDWSERWPDASSMNNKDAAGIAHYPGWSLPVLTYLYETRHVTATGHETSTTDPGVATSTGDYSLMMYVLSTDHWQVELMTDLDQVPEAGAMVVVSVPKPEDAPAFTARVFAILP